MSPTKVSHFDRGVWRSLIWVDITVSKVTKSKGDGSSFLKLMIDIITIFRSYVLLQNWMIPQWHSEAQGSAGFWTQQNCPSLVIVGPQVCLLIEWFEHGQILYIALLDLSFLHNLPPMKEFGSIHFTTTATPHFGHLSVSALSPFVTPQGQQCLRCWRCHAWAYLGLRLLAEGCLHWWHGGRCWGWLDLMIH